MSSNRSKSSRLASTRFEVGEPHFRLDAELKYTYANRIYEELIGTQGSVVGRPFTSVQPQPPTSDLLISMRACLTDGVVVTHSDYCMNGGVWVEYRLSRVGNEISVLLLNVDQRMRADLKLVAESTRAHECMAGAPVAIGQLGIDGRWLAANARAEQIFGVDISQLRGRKFSEFCTPTDRRRDDERCAAMIAGAAESYVSERMIQRPDGDECWIRMNISLVRSKQGRAQFFAIVFDRIDERKDAEESLGFALESARMGEWNFDIVTNTTRRSQRFNDIFGIAKDDLEWGFENFLTQIHDDDRDRFEVKFEEAIQNGRGLLFEGRILRVDGTVRWIWLSGRVYANREGLAMRIAGLVRDVTDEKCALNEAEHAKLAAEDANREKSYFLANMSHEIRTPLGAILGFTEALRDRGLSEADHDRYLQILSRNGQSLARLIDDILDLSKVEAGFLEVEIRPVHIMDLVNEVIALLKVKADAKKLTLTVQAARFPDVMKTDPIRLRQMLINIVGNAIKFTSSGEVRVTVKLLEESEAPTLAFYVRDSGIGIKPSTVDRLFNPFSQADSSTARKFGGTGLGLSLSRRLARAMGGDLMLGESTPGKGSTFVILIPAIASTEETSVVDKNVETRRSELPTGLHVLLAEDSPDNQELILRMLSPKSAFISLAENGAEAFAKATQDKFDIVLMDMHMPEVDGYEATRRLRNSGFLGPIIALTANAMRHDREKCLEAGCSDYVSKPIDPAKLFLAMGNALENARH